MKAETVCCWSLGHTESDAGVDTRHTTTQRQHNPRHCDCQHSAALSVTTNSLTSDQHHHHQHLDHHHRYSLDQCCHQNVKNLVLK